MTKYLFIFITAIITSCTHVPSDTSGQFAATEQISAQNDNTAQTINR